MLSAGPDALSIAPTRRILSSLLPPRRDDSSAKLPRSGAVVGVVDMESLLNENGAAAECIVSVTGMGRRRNGIRVNLAGTSLQPNPFAGPGHWLAVARWRFAHPGRIGYRGSWLRWGSRRESRISRNEANSQRQPSSFVFLCAFASLREIPLDHVIIRARASSTRAKRLAASNL